MSRTLTAWDAGGVSCLLALAVKRRRVFAPTATERCLPFLLFQGCQRGTSDLGNDGASDLAPGEHSNKPVQSAGEFVPASRDHGTLDVQEPDGPPAEYGEKEIRASWTCGIEGCVASAVGVTRSSFLFARPLCCLPPDHRGVPTLAGS